MERGVVPIPPDLAKRRERILRLIEEVGTQKALAEALGMTESRVSKALSPETVSDRRLAPIERAISEWKDSKGQSGGEVEPKEGHERTSGAAQLNVKAFSVRAGGVVVDERVTGEYVVDAGEIESLYEHRPSAPFVVEMIGESMEPDFRSGDRLIIEPYPRGTREIQASAIYLFRLEGLVEVKQIEYLPGQRLLVRPRNPAYREYEVAMFDEIDYEILGRVWGKFKRY